MDALAALVGQALATGSELHTARAWSLLTADDMGLRLGLISLEANTFERNLTVWADLGWVVEVFGVAITDTVFRNYQVPSPAQDIRNSAGLASVAWQLHVCQVIPAACISSFPHRQNLQRVLPLAHQHLARPPLLKDDSGLLLSELA